MCQADTGKKGKTIVLPRHLRAREGRVCGGGLSCCSRCQSARTRAHTQTLKHSGTFPDATQAHITYPDTDTHTKNTLTHTHTHTQTRANTQAHTLMGASKEVAASKGTRQGTRQADKEQLLKSQHSVMQESEN